MTELKPCPNCGGDAEIYESTKENYGYWYAAVGVRCKKCSVHRGNFEDQEFDHKKRMHINKRKEAEKSAADLWNDREVKSWFTVAEN